MFSFLKQNQSCESLDSYDNPSHYCVKIENSRIAILFSLQKLYFHLYLQLVNRNDFELERREHT